MPPVQKDHTRIQRSDCGSEDLVADDTTDTRHPFAFHFIRIPRLDQVGRHVDHHFTVENRAEHPLDPIDEVVDLAMYGLPRRERCTLTP